MMTNNFNKNFIWNIIGTTANAITSLVYLIIVTRLNGLNTAGIFTFAFSNANVFAIVGMYMGRTYQVSDSKCSERSFINVRIITCALMFISASVIACFYGYSAENMMIYMLWLVYKVIDAYADVIYGVLQKNDRLYCVGVSLAVKAVLGMLLFFIIDYHTKNVALASCGAVIANLAVVLVYDISHYRNHAKKDECSKEEVNFLLKDGFFIFGTTLLSNYLINASKYAINLHGSNEEQAVFGIILMPATVMILIAQYLIQPYLMQLTLLFRKEKYRRMMTIVKRIILALVGAGLLGMKAAAIFGIPFLELIYGIELGSYKIDLLIVIAGAICYGVVTILVNVLTVMHKTKIQLLGFALTSLSSYLISRYLVILWGIRGATMAYIISMVTIIIFFVILISVMWRQTDKI